MWDRINGTGIFTFWSAIHAGKYTSRMDKSPSYLQGLEDDGHGDRVLVSIMDM